MMLNTPTFAKTLFGHFHIVTYQVKLYQNTLLVSCMYKMQLYQKIKQNVLN